MMKERIEEQYAWRKEQLERETAALLQRKKAVIAQLNNLKALAGEAESNYPDADPFAEQVEEETTEDTTIVIDPKAPQAGQKPAPSGTGQSDQSIADGKEAAPQDNRANQRTQVIPAVRDNKSAQPSGATAADESDNEKTQVLPQGTEPGK